MRRICSICLSVAVVAVVAGAFAPSAMAAGSFTCRASALRITSLFLNSEPVVANKASNPCADDFATAIATTGLITANIPKAETDATANSATSSASVASVTDLLGIAIGAVESKASATCVGGVHPSVKLAGSSSIATLSIGGMPLVIGDQPVTIPLGLVNLYLNEQVVGPGKITQRAVRISSPLLGLEIVLAESIASGAACK